MDDGKKQTLMNDVEKFIDEEIENLQNQIEKLLETKEKIMKTINKMG